MSYSRTIAALAAAALTFSLAPSSVANAASKAPGKATKVVVTVNNADKTATVSWVNADRAARHEIAIDVNDWPCVTAGVIPRQKAGVRSITIGIKQMNYCPTGEWVIRIASVKTSSTGKARRSVTTTTVVVNESPWIEENPVMFPGGGREAMASA